MEIRKEVYKVEQMTEGKQILLPSYFRNITSKPLMIFRKHSKIYSAEQYKRC